jgi:putative membrane protein
MTGKLILTSALALALAACNNAEQSPANETGLANGAISTAVEDTAAQATGAVAAPLANSVEAFVTNAAIGDMYEIESSKIAAEKSKSPAVKAFAAMMIKDHTGTTAKLKGAIASENLSVALPATPDDRRAGLLANLRSASADDFDKVYLDQQTAAHSETLSLMKSYADDGENAALKALAAATAPIVQTHYEEVQKLDAAGADGTRK